MANTLAYYDTATITAIKSFIVQAPVGYLLIWQSSNQKGELAPYLPTPLLFDHLVTWLKTSVLVPFPTLILRPSEAGLLNI